MRHPGWPYILASSGLGGGKAYRFTATRLGHGFFLVTKQVCEHTHTHNQMELEYSTKQAVFPLKKKPKSLSLIQEAMEIGVAEYIK